MDGGGSVFFWAALKTWGRRSGQSSGVSFRILGTGSQAVGSETGFSQRTCWVLKGLRRNIDLGFESYHARGTFHGLSRRYVGFSVRGFLLGFGF